MILQDITYLQLKFADIKNPIEYFKTGGTINDMNLLRTLYNNIKLIWKLGNSEVNIALAENQEIYRFSLIHKRTIFGFVIYIPGLKRIDLYTSENTNVPLIQWKGKKVVYRAYPLLLEKAGLEKVFEKLTTVL